MDAHQVMDLIRAATCLLGLAAILVIAHYGLRNGNSGAEGSVIGGILLASGLQFYRIVAPWPEPEVLDFETILLNASLWCIHLGLIRWAVQRGRRHGDAG